MKILASFFVIISIGFFLNIGYGQIDVLYDFESADRGAPFAHCTTGRCPEGFWCGNDASLVPIGAPIYTLGYQGCLTEPSPPALPQGAHSGDNYVNFYAAGDALYFNRYDVRVQECTLIEFCVWLAGPPAGTAAGAQNNPNNSFIEFGYDPYITAGNDFEFRYKTAKSPPPVEGQDWTQYCYILDVPAGNHQFGIKSGVAAQFSLWIDDFTMKSYEATAIIEDGSDTIRICPGSTQLLNASLELSPGAETTLPLTPQYEWQDGSNESYLLVEDPGTYTVEINYGSCYSRTAEVVVILDSTRVNLGNETQIVCAGETLELDASLNVLPPPIGTTQIPVFTWQDGTNGSKFNVAEPGTYSVKAQYGTCYSTFSETNVLFDSIPRVNLGLDTTLCLGDVYETLNLDATYKSSSNNTKYLWQNGDTSSTFFVNKEGTYTVDVTNSCGIASDNITVNYNFCFCNVFVPNSFTPDGNSVNQVFNPVIYCFGDIMNYTFRIFDRWGEEVFSTTDQSDAWDGTYLGVNCTTGTYTYQVIYTPNETNITESIIGHVNLFR